MSGSPQNTASEESLAMNQATARENYGIALPALKKRQDSLNAALGLGESQLLKDAGRAERTALTETGAANADQVRAGQTMRSKSALSGGNVNATLTPSDIGAQLADALYGSKYREGQADINEKMNHFSMALGGAGASGNAALNASGQNLNAIRYLPAYNQNYANVVGGLSAAATVYGGLNQAYPQLFGQPGTTNTGAILPTSTIYPSAPQGGGGGY